MGVLYTHLPHSDHKIYEGYHNGTGYVLGDTNLLLGNIKIGSTIFGVTGTAIGPPGAATDDQVLTGITYSNASGLSTGTMANNGEGSTITPGTTYQTVAAGYWSSDNTVAGDTDLTAGNIATGKEIFGVFGSAAAAKCVSADYLTISYECVGACYDEFFLGDPPTIRRL